MKCRSLFVALAACLLLQFASANSTSGTISAVNSLTPPSFTTNSAVELSTGGQGIQSVVITVSTIASGTALHVYYQDPVSSLYYQIPDALIQNYATGSFGPIPAPTSGTTSYVVQTPPGNVWLYASALSSGSTTVGLSTVSLTGGFYNTTSPTLSNGQFSPFQMWSDGSLMVYPDPASTFVMGLQFNGSNVTASNPLPVNNTAVTYGGTTTYCPVAGLTSGSLTSIKATPGSLYGMVLTNTNSGVVYVNFYNQTSSFSYGTTVPFYSIGLQANQTLVVGPTSIPVAFTTLINYTVSTSLSSFSNPTNPITGTVFYQ